MSGKKKWFLLGLLGAVGSVVFRLVRGRRQEQIEAGRWEPVGTGAESQAKATEPTEASS